MTNLFSLVAGVTAFLSLLMIAACGRHWFREYVGLRKSLNTFAVSFGIVAVYYTILDTRFCHLVPVSAAGKSARSSLLLSCLRWSRKLPSAHQRRAFPRKAVILSSRKLQKLNRSTGVLME
jgi:hypothetical protein